MAFKRPPFQKAVNSGHSFFDVNTLRRTRPGLMGIPNQLQHPDKTLSDIHFDVGLVPKCH